MVSFPRDLHFDRCRLKIARAMNRGALTFYGKHCTQYAAVLFGRRGVSGTARANEMRHGMARPL